LVALAAFGDADLIREELGSRELTDYDCVLDLDTSALPHSPVAIIIRRIQDVAIEHWILLRWGPRLLPYS
jgi:hypothetical protein